MTTSASQHTGPSRDSSKWRRVVRKKNNSKEIKAKELDWISSLLIISVLLVLDCLVIGHIYGLFRLPGEMGPVDLAKNGAIAYMDRYYENLKKENDGALEVASTIMDSYKNDILEIKSTEAVGQIMAEMVQRTSSEVEEERLRLAEERTLELLNSDSNILGNTNATGSIILNVINGKVELTDKFNLVRRDTRDIISKDEIILRCPPYPIEIVVEEGDIRLSTPDLEQRIASMTKEIELLRKDIKEIGELSGNLEVWGEGIEVYAYDSPEGYSWSEIVHESDIKDIIDCLMAAGAIGVQVGNERVVANTSIRCIGPIILVNQNPVAVNPIKLVAVGNKNDLAKALSSLQDKFDQTGKKIEVVKSNNLSLVAYKRG